MINLKYILTRTIIAVIVLLAITEIDAQLYTGSAILPVPSAPETASLNKFVDVGVSEYNGTANISYPLHTVNWGEINVPIGIAYHSQGVRVSEEASWVGLGWTLSAGGAITRQIRDKDDFGYRVLGEQTVRDGYYESPQNTSLPANYFVNNAGEIIYASQESQSNNEHLAVFVDPLNNSQYSAEPQISEYEQLCNYEYLDLEPDIFTYSCGGYSGKFLFDAQKNKFVSLTDHNIVIEISESGLDQIAFTITTPEGFTYFFGSAIGSRQHTYQFASTANIPKYGEGLGALNIGLGDDFISSWYLDKIESPNGYTVEFSYDKDGNKVSPIPTYSDTYRLVYGACFGVVSNCNSGGGAMNGILDQTTSTISYSDYDKLYLSSINFPNGQVLFNRSDDRVDLKNADRLSSISVVGKNNTMLKEISFNQTYFNSKSVDAANKWTHIFSENPQSLGNIENYLDEIITPDREQKRLKLDNFVVKDKVLDKEQDPVTAFSYINESTLLPKTSFSVDHWGYPNNDGVSVPDNRVEVDDPLIHDVSWHKIAPNSSYYPSAYFNDPLPSLPYFFPVGESTICYSNGVSFLDGAARDVSPEHTQDGLLNKVTNTLGGSTDYNYENNVISDNSVWKISNKREVKINAGFPCYKVQEMDPDPDPKFETTFFVTEGLYEQNKNIINLKLRVNKLQSCNYIDFCQTEVKYSIKLSKIVNGSKQLIYPKLVDEYQDISPGINSIEFDFASILLDQGEYALTIERSNSCNFFPYDHSVELFAEFLDFELTPDYGPGVRVSSIEQKGVDANTQHIYKSFSYDGGKLLTARPVYVDDRKVTQFGDANITEIDELSFNFQELTPVEDEEGNVIVYHIDNEWVSSYGSAISCTSELLSQFSSHYVYSSSVNATNNGFGGSNFGYDMVTSSFGPDGAGGRIENTYYNEDIPTDVNASNFNIQTLNLQFPIHYNFKNGLLNKSEVYNSSGTMLSRSVNVYSLEFDKYDWIWTFKVLPITQAVGQSQILVFPANACNSKTYQKVYYANIPQWNKLDFTINTVYAENGFSPLITTTNYTYYEDNNRVVENLLATKTTTYDNDSQCETTYEYTEDIEASKRACLINKNIFTTPLKVTTSGGCNDLTSEVTYSDFLDIDLTLDVCIPRQYIKYQKDQSQLVEIEIDEVGEYGLVEKLTRFGQLPETYTYTNINQLHTKSINVNGQDWTTTFNYDPNTLILESIEQLDGLKAEFTTDGLGRNWEAKAYFADGTLKSTSSNEYDYASGTITSKTSYKNGLKENSEIEDKVVVNQVDQLGRPLTSTSLAFASGMDVITQSNIYDSGINRVISTSILPNDHLKTITYEHSPLNRVLEEEFPDTDDPVKYSYGANSTSIGAFGIGQLSKTKITDENGNINASYGDRLGRTIATVNPNGLSDGKTEYSYDAYGQLTDIVSPEGQPYNYVYDDRYLLENKTIPGAGTIVYTYYPENYLLHTSTDANGNELTYDYDDLNRNTKVYLGNELIMENFYDSYPSHATTCGNTSGSILRGKMTATRTKVLDEDIWLWTVYDYDQAGRVKQTCQENPQGLPDVTAVDYNNADQITASSRNLDGLIVGTGEIEYDTWDRMLTSATSVGGQAMQMIESSYFPEGLLMQKNLGEMQSIDYHYNNRGWLRSINQNLTSFTPTMPLASCDDVNTEADNDNVDAIETYLINIEELLALRFNLTFSDVENDPQCQQRQCPLPGCDGVSIANQIATYIVRYEDMIEDISTTKVIPCIIDNVETTQEVTTIEVTELEFPVILHRVRLCDNTPIYLLDQYLIDFPGNIEIEQTIEILDKDQVVSVELNGEYQNLTVVPLLEELLKEQYVDNKVGDFVDCGDLVCETYEDDCLNSTILIQKEALEIIKENYEFSNVIICPDFADEEIGQRSTSFVFPFTVHQVALCDGQTFWVTVEEWNDVMSSTGATIISTKIFDDCNDEMVISDVLTPEDKEDLFCLQLDYEPNGNIETQLWQVAGREVFKYAYGYDPLNRVLSAAFSEHFSDGSGLQKTTEQRFSVSGIQYSPDGNIENLNRNGINGYCNDGIPEYGPIDALTYTYDGPMLTSVEDNVLPEEGGNYGYPTIGGTNPYGYDSNGNITTDPSRNANISYNYLNLPSIITASDVTINYIYDASGVKWKKIFRKGTDFTRVTEYIGGIEYVGEGSGDPNGIVTELTSVFLDEGRAAKTGDGWQMEYVLRDHLGNTRVAFSDLNNDGKISKAKEDGEILQEHHIYPFGMSWESSAQSPWYRHPKVDENKDNNYQYNGKELQDEVLFDIDGVEVQLGYYEYGARFYDPAIGRFTGVDPIADQFAHVSVYNYAENMVPNAIDLWGLQSLLIIKTKNRDGSIATDEKDLINDFDPTYTTYANPTKYGNRGILTVNIDANGDFVSESIKYTLSETFANFLDKFNKVGDGMVVEGDNSGPGSLKGAASDNVPSSVETLSGDGIVPVVLPDYKNPMTQEYFEKVMATNQDIEWERAGKESFGISVGPVKGKNKDVKWWGNQLYHNSKGDTVRVKIFHERIRYTTKSGVTVTDSQPLNNQNE